jgi:hypothetical protein
VAGSRRLSQRISEGDGIAIIVRVADAEGARVAEAEGAKALAISGDIAGIRDASGLPLLWLSDAHPSDADAVVRRPAVVADLDGVELVVDVRDEDELELALDQFDPEIFLLCGEGSDEHDDPLDAVLELLPDVPAGKLAIADVAVASREEVLALERAGIDAVLVPPGSVADLVGHAPFDV